MRAPRVKNDCITVYSNAIDQGHWIELLERIHLECYQFTHVDYRPHLTMEIPFLHNRSDSYAGIELRSMFQSLLNDSLHDYMRSNNVLRMEPLKSTLTASKLLEGQDMFVHRDTPMLESDSFIAQLYINDDYEGGELFFPDHEYIYKPVAGDLAYYRMADSHGVRKLINGVRYTIGYSLQGPFS